MEENGSKRLKELEKLYTQIPGIEREVFSVETLLDILLVLYDECNTPLLKRDKHVTDFIDIGKVEMLLPVEFFFLLKISINFLQLAYYLHLSK